MAKEYQYEFDLDIIQINLEKVPRGSVEIWWSKGPNKITTKRRITVSATGKWYDVSQKLGIKAVCKWNNGKFQSKMYDIKVMVVNGSSGKENPEVFGLFHLDISSILLGNQPTKSVTKTKQDFLQNYSGQVNYVLSAKYIQQLSPSPLDNTVSEYSMTRPISRHSENSAQFSFQVQSTARESSQDRQAPNSGNNETFLQLIQVKRRLDQKNKEVEKLQEQLSRKEDVLKSFQGQLRNRDVKLMNDANVLTTQNSNLRMQIEELNRVMSRMREQQYANQDNLRRIQQLEAQNLRKYNQYVAIENRNTQKVRDTASMNQKLNQQNSAMNNQLFLLNERVKEGERVRYQQELAHGNQRSQNQAKIKMLEEKTREKESVVEKIKSEFDNYNLQRNNLLVKQRHIQSQLEQQSGTIKRLQESVSSYRGKVQQLESQLQRVNTQTRTKLQAQQKECIGRVRELEEACQKKDKDLKERVAIIDQAKEFVEYKEGEISKRDEFIARCKEYIASKEQELGVATSNAQKFRCELGQKDNIIVKLKQDNISLTERLRVTLQEASFSRQQIQIKERYLSEYLSDLAAQTSKTSQLQEQIQALRGQLQEEASQSMAREEQLKSNLAELIRQNVEYKMEISKSHNELRRLQDKPST